MGKDIHSLLPFHDVFQRATLDARRKTIEQARAEGIALPINRGDGVEFVPADEIPLPGESGKDETEAGGEPRAESQVEAAAG